jgi:predicted alpha-1,2-mannosidase
MGKMDDYDKLMKWSQNYRNVYNKEKGFMLPRNYNGSWIDIDESDRTGLTEGSKWTYLFCVLQDIPGMIELMGRKKRFSEKLDRNFNEGHYVHENEPGHHYIYLYNYSGQSWKTQELIRKQCRESYKNAPNGLKGNDDCGQMSAWYLFSVMGFYPVTPASNQFVIGAPQFPYFELDLNVQGKSKKLIIKANNLSEANKYVKNVKLDGKTVKSFLLDYFDLINAQELAFEMTDRPTKL